jgi:hypothetical protein
MTEQMDAAKRIVGHNYAMSFDLGNNRSIQVNGNFYVDDDIAAMNAKLDQIWVVLERLRAKVQVETLILDLKQAKTMVLQTEELLLRAEAGNEVRQKSGKLVTTQQSADLANLHSNLLKQRQDVKNIEEMLGEKRAQAA